jgi:hypothetical protein
MRSDLKVARRLKKMSLELLDVPPGLCEFTHDAKANELLNDIQGHPHALVLACLMARRWKAENCWLVPYLFSQRFGSFEMSDLTTLTLTKTKRLFNRKPVLHRMKDIMSGVFLSAVLRIGSAYAGDASRIWRGKPSSASLVRAFLEFKGAGPKIATMAANILVRDFKVPVSDYYSIDVSPDVQVRRSFTRLGLVAAGSSNEVLIYRARELNPEYPGVFDMGAWDLGRRWCRPNQPLCDSCPLSDVCPSAGAS